MADDEATTTATPPENPAPPHSEPPQRQPPQRQWAVTASILVTVAVLVVTALLVTGQYVRSIHESRGFTVDPAPGLTVPTPAIVANPFDAPEPTKEAVAAALAPYLSDPDLGSLAGHITDAITGTVLWTQDPTTARVPASSTKILTAAAALLALPHNTRVTTKVVRGEAPGEVILVGGGDVTLSAQPLGESTYYWDAPRLDDLVNQLETAGTEVTAVQVDSSAYDGPKMAREWLTQSIDDGFIAPIEPVMLDGGRLIATEPESPRSTEPARAAAQTLASRLGLDAAAIEAVAEQTAAPDAEVLAEVASAPLLTRIRQFMVESDNVLAEAVGREIAIAAGETPSFRGTSRAIRSTLATNGLLTDGVTLEDASGLSRRNQISVAVIDSVISTSVGTVRSDEQGRATVAPANAAVVVKLRPLLDTFPVAAGSGTLETRFDSDASTPGVGWVRAKTGTLDGVSALAGYTVTRSERILTFAFISSDSNAFASRPALDALAAQLRTLDGDTDGEN
ncbi:D-alanyl-D-alanine carboxypeptidase/D-alanyl-D-alanine-endopeptidase [Hoyosella rhizosphaerae]|nr:D-alanyl-D-alanine carboxypeptidase/D-alanyl-D-alanine-endopeptidase [Hoyosella rhizosphaerae]MBN4925328.1 D-alanyl-D-alanine carboxypeptidase/D-alanyl-D-alanine-endopeptidase [Hoyosella rhizosphaerae]